jgi:hypothetical protein
MIWMTSAILLLHLPGKHNQKDHGRSKGSSTHSLSQGKGLSKLKVQVNAPRPGGLLFPKSAGPLKRRRR